MSLRIKSWQEPVFSIGLIVLVTMTFVRVISFDFVLFDDSVHLADNPYLSTLQWKSFLELWKHSYFGMYIPISYSAWYATALFARLINPEAAFNPSLFHLLNLLLHAANAVAVMKLFQKLGASRLAAFAGASLFALHPVQVEAVAWVSCLKDVLSALFVLVALNYALPSPDQKLRPWAATFFYFLAVLAKPSTVVAPLLLALLHRGWLRRPIKTVLPLVIFWILASFPLISVTRGLQPDPKTGLVPPFFLRHFIAGDALSFYLWKVLWPFNLNLDYGRTPAHVLASGWGYLTWLAPGFLALLALSFPSSKFRALVALWVVSLLPVLGFLPFRFQQFSTVADRYLYLAILTPSLGLAYYWDLPWKTTATKARLLISGALLLFLATVDQRQCSVWRNSHTLFDHVLGYNNQSLIAHNNLANAFEREGKLELALRHYLIALKLKPDWLDVRYNVANVYAKLKRYEACEREISELLKIGPAHPEAHYLLGVIYYETGRLPLAVRALENAVLLDPNNVKFLNKLGVVLTLSGRYFEAREMYLRSLAVDPKLPETYNNLGVAELRLGHKAQAHTYFEKALSLFPQHKEARLNWQRTL